MSRYDMTDFEWSVIQPMLPDKPRGVPRVDDRRVLNGIFWVLRSGAPWADLPERYGPRTTVYNRFNRWRKVGVWDRTMDAITAAYDGKVQMIDTCLACACISMRAALKRGSRSLYGAFARRTDHENPRACGRQWLPVRLGLTAGEAHDNRLVATLLNGLDPKTMLLADRGYDADWVRRLVNERGGWANIPPKRNRRQPICFSPFLYKDRNLVERFFNKLKHFRRSATRYDKLAANFLAMLKLACVRLWLRVNESTA
jgi:transposase